MQEQPKFEKTEINLGEMSPGKITQFAFKTEEPFKVEDGRRQVDYFNPGCGCTQASYDPGLPGIVGSFNIDKAVNWGNVSEAGETVSRIIQVALDSDIPDFIVDANTYKRIKNPAKKTIMLKLTAKAKK